VLADPIDPQRGALVIASPSARGVIAALGEHSVGFASGWMQLRRCRHSMDRGFVFSDHADWPGLLRAIAATGAERVIVTHGQEAVMGRWLREQGLQAGSFGAEPGRACGQRTARRAGRGRWPNAGRHHSDLDWRELMRRFASLCAELSANSASSATEAKLAALQRYLAGADPADAAWALPLLVGGKPRRAMPAALLRAEACVAAGMPDWLFEASLQAPACQ